MRGRFLPLAAPVAALNRPCPGPLPSHTLAYSYDGVNRLASGVAKDLSSNTLWSQTYSYDRWGNM